MLTLPEEYNWNISSFSISIYVSHFNPSSSDTGPKAGVQFHVDSGYPVTFPSSHLGAGNWIRPAFLASWLLSNPRYVSTALFGTHTYQRGFVSSLRGQVAGKRDNTGDQDSRAGWGLCHHPAHHPFYSCPCVSRLSTCKGHLRLPCTQIIGLAIPGSPAQLFLLHQKWQKSIMAI